MSAVFHAATEMKQMLIVSVTSEWIATEIIGLAFIVQRLGLLECPDQWLVFHSTPLGRSRFVCRLPNDLKVTLGMGIWYLVSGIRYDVAGISFPDIRYPESGIRY